MTDHEQESDSNLGEETYQTLLHDILSARLPGGMAIQQRRLALEYQVSRSPMRTALSRLEGEGLLVRDETGALKVRTVTLTDYLHALDIRMLLEPTAAANACKSPDAAKLTDLFARFQSVADNPTPDPEEVWALDDSLHGYIAAQSGNPFMVSFIRDLRRFTTIFERQLPVVRAKPGMREHAAILDALQGGESEVARAAMSFHLEIVRIGVLKNY
ncbi:GntR family transcriptional regulator [Mesobacterium pallidum]|uniref:GntR family transcriptional regulator n=1 Tax=Mesobacterium pallidum TaxID=2872037 RepID=UPI001EE24387|nr:GntR family transcriptional regulator [Mesobacterium pallidum]